MQRRDFLRVVPAALAGAAIPAVATSKAIFSIQGGLIDPIQPIWGRQGEWALYSQGKQAPTTKNGGEPPENSSVIRVEITPVGPLPVIEMVGPYLTNPDAFFGEVEWEQYQHPNFPQVFIKEARGFLRKEDAVFHKTDAGCFWVCYGVVRLRLTRFDGFTGSTFDCNVRAIPESILHRVDGSAIHVRG